MATQTPAYQGDDPRFVRAARHSRRVRWLRRAVPAVVILSLALIIGASVFNPFRFLKNFAPTPGDPAVMAFMKARIDGALAIVNKRLEKSPFLTGDRPNIADISMCAYLYYPAEEYGFDIRKDHPAIGAFLDRVAALPGWAHPYDIMPGYPFGTQGFRNSKTKA